MIHRIFMEFECPTNYWHNLQSPTLPHLYSVYTLHFFCSLPYFFSPSDAPIILDILEDLKFDSMEESDTKNFFVLLTEYLHALNDTQQKYIIYILCNEPSSGLREFSSLFFRRTISATRLYLQFFILAKWIHSLLNYIITLLRKLLQILQKSSVTKSALNGMS